MNNKADEGEDHKDEKADKSLNLKGHKGQKVHKKGAVGTDTGADKGGGADIDWI